MDPLIEIHWTGRASEDPEVIVRYIARRNPEAAGRIGRGFFTKVKILRQFPELGLVLDEFRDRGWRKLIYRRWKIIHTYRNGEIIIGRVWPTTMGAVDPDTSLEREEWQSETGVFAKSSLKPPNPTGCHDVALAG